VKQQCCCYFVEVSLVLPVVGLECRIILLVICFICMVALVLSFACDQVVFLRIVLSLVALQLEKARKYSIVVYMLSLVI
jgi:hypothetical protein